MPVARTASQEVFYAGLCSVRWQAQRVAKTECVDQQSENRASHREERKVKVRAGELALHIQGMAEWVENERMNDQSSHVDEEQTTDSRART